MRKNKFLIISVEAFIFLCCYIVSAFAEDLTISDFKFGLMKQNEQGQYYVYEPTKRIPIRKGTLFGFSYKFSKNSEEPVKETVTLVMSAPANTIKNLDKENILEVNSQKNTLISTNLIKDKQGDWIFVSGMDEDDPAGNEQMIIYHNNKLFKKINYEVVEEQ